MKRLLVALVVVSGMVIGVAAPAGAVASPYTRNDPITGENNYARNDIKSMRIVHDDTVTLTLRTEVGANPATHTAWRAANGSTYLAWTLDGAEDGAFFNLVMRSTASGPGDPTLTAIFPLPCLSSDITFTFISPNGYQFSFPRTCILNTASFRAYATYRFNPAGAPVPKSDRIPNTGYTPTVTPAA